MKKTFKIIALTTFLALGAFSFVPKASADATDKLSGYASSGAGPISFNCTNDASCATTSYGVTTDASGNFSGKAWNPTVGWISFDAADIAGCPSSCTQVKYIITGKISGWARIMGAGYIHFSDDVTFPSPLFDGSAGATLLGDEYRLTGNAWSDDIGWIDLNGVRITRLTSGTLVDFRAGNIGFIFSPLHGSVSTINYDLRSGQSVNLNWVVDNATSCSGNSSPVDPLFNGPVSFSALATNQVSVSPSVTTTYTLSCTGASSINKAIVVHVGANPALSLNGSTEASPTASMSSGGAGFPMNFSWSVDPQFTSCSADVKKYDNTTGTIIPQMYTSPLWQGTNTLVGGTNLLSGGRLPVVVNDFGAFHYDFTLTCSTGGGYTATRTFVLNHDTSTGPNPSILSPTNSTVTVDPNSDLYLRIYTQVARCTLTQSVPTASGGPSGWDTFVVPVTPGWYVDQYVHINVGTASGTLTITCWGPRGNIVATRVVTLIVNGVAIPPPTVTLTAIPSTVPANTGTDLYYTSTNTASCTTTPSSTPAANGATGWDGTALVANGTNTPEAIPNDVPVMMATTTTTFYIQCIGLDGSTVNSSTTVTIVPVANPPQLWMSGPLTLFPPNSLVTPSLTYQSAYTDMCKIADGPFNVGNPQFPLDWANPPPYTTAGTAPLGWIAGTSIPSNSGPLTPMAPINGVTVGSQNTNFWLHCHGLDGSDVFRSQTVSVNTALPAPTLTIEAWQGGTQISSPVAANSAIILKYTSTNTASCRVPTTVPDGFPPYQLSGAGTNPSGWTTALNPLVSGVAPPTTSANVTMGNVGTTFYIYCMGSDGTSIAANVFVDVVSIPPVYTIPSALVSGPDCQSIGPITITTNITDPDNEIISCSNIGTNPGPWDITPPINNSIPLPVVGTPAQVILSCLTQHFGTITIGSSPSIGNAAEPYCAPEPGSGIGNIHFQEH